MSDIVERLRSGEDGLEYAAADEIEQLVDAMKAALECIDADDVIGAYTIITKAINEVGSD